MNTPTNTIFILKPGSHLKYGIFCWFQKSIKSSSEFIQCILHKHYRPAIYATCSSRLNSKPIWDQGIKLDLTFCSSGTHGSIKRKTDTLCKWKYSVIFIYSVKLLKKSQLSKCFSIDLIGSLNAELVSIFFTIYSNFLYQLPFFFFDRCNFRSKFYEGS